MFFFIPTLFTQQQLFAKAHTQYFTFYMQLRKVYIVFMFPFETVNLATRKQKVFKRSEIQEDLLPLSTHFDHLKAFFKKRPALETRPVRTKVVGVLMFTNSAS